VGSAEEPASLERFDQGCLGPSRGLEDPHLPLSNPKAARPSPCLRAMSRLHPSIYAYLHGGLDPKEHQTGLLYLLGIFQFIIGLGVMRHL
jgi:hypothetical protein